MSFIETDWLIVTPPCWGTVDFPPPGLPWTVKNSGLTVRLTTSFLFRPACFDVVAKRRCRPLSPAVGVDCTIGFIAGERVGVRGTRLALITHWPMVTRRVSEGLVACSVAVPRLRVGLPSLTSLDQCLIKADST